MIGAAIRGLAGREQRAQVVDSEGQAWTVASDGSVSGGPSAESALTIPVVYAGVSQISEAMRLMPLELLARDAAGWQGVVRDHRVAHMLTCAPNPEQSAGEVWELLVAWMLLRGNAYLWKERDELGRVVALWPIPPTRVSPRRDEKTLRKVFDLYSHDDAGTRVPNGVATQADLIHFRAFGTDPLRGLGIIEALRELSSRSRAEEQYVGATLKNGARPSGVLEAPAGLSQDAVKRLAAGWKQHAGSGNAGGTPILNDGVTWKQVSLSAADLQFLEQRGATRQEWAAALKLPATRLNASSGGGTLHYDSSEMDGRHFATYTMLPWANRIEDALKIDRDIPWRTIARGAGRTVEPQFNVDEFLRASLKERATANAIGVKGGWLHPDEIREAERLPVRADLPTPQAAPNGQGGDTDA